MPQNKKPSEPDDKLRFLVDRMAILLVVAKMRYGNDWNPFFQLKIPKIFFLYRLFMLIFKKLDGINHIFF